METTALMPAHFTLRELLDEVGVSQSDFAREADLSFATVNRLCTNATAQVSLETLDKILRALRQRGFRRAGVADVIAWEPQRGKGK
jgi:transcriptional regulator with XRE-family HTH domain